MNVVSEDKIKRKKKKNVDFVLMGCPNDLIDCPSMHNYVLMHKHVLMLEYGPKRAHDLYALVLEVHEADSFLFLFLFSKYFCLPLFLYYDGNLIFFLFGGNFLVIMCYSSIIIWWDFYGQFKMFVAL